MSTTSSNPFTRHHQPRKVLNPGTQRFLFATGIECTYPTIEWEGRRVRQDELAKCGHYERWREDFEATLELGIRLLRYGPPYFAMHTAPGRYDWSWTDQVLPDLREKRITPVIDLCHFGVPDYGWWNERLRTHQGFVTALKHLVSANVRAMVAILERNIRPVGEAYRTLVEQWHNLPVLPNGPFSYPGVWHEATEDELAWPPETSRAPPSHAGA